jgi:uncharacterized protein (TIGR02246 family)
MTRSNSMRTLRALVVGGILVGVCLDAHAQGTAKPQYIWNQQEREAAEVVKAWIAAFATKDPQKVASYMAENCVFRGDPSQPLQKGREAFVKEISGFIGVIANIKIDEIYVTGNEWDTAVLTKRTDTLSPNAGGPLGGKAVPLAGFFRVKNKKITEWLDVPLFPLPAPPPTPAPRSK